MNDMTRCLQGIRAAAIVVLSAQPWLAYADGRTDTIVLEGQTAPDGNGAFGRLEEVSLNAGGQVAFQSLDMTGTSGGANDDQGVFRGSGAEVTQIAREGQAAPDGNGAFGGFTGVGLNTGGQVAFGSFLMTGTSGGTGDNEGVFRGSGGNLTQIARKGQSAPDGNGAFGTSIRIALNAAGQVAFDSFFMTGTSGGFSDNEGVFRGSGGLATRIARKGQAAPDG
ncbi:MAG: hypothetical protein KJO38_05495, partial [Gammaproteobacteria bacterium]|nr:hypothetical protein [Gammaproteobacteria bacterium]